MERERLERERIRIEQVDLILILATRDLCHYPTFYAASGIIISGDEPNQMFVLLYGDA